MTAHRQRILVLASDDGLLIELEHSLEDLGFDTSTTWDWAEALKLARAGHFDLLLIAEHPPEVSAVEFLRELQCGPGGVPCLVLQRSPGPFSEQYFYSLGASGVVVGRRYEEIGQRVQEWFCANRAAAA
jgi:CheY-like chemotaxis protein